MSEPSERLRRIREERQRADDLWRATRESLVVGQKVVGTVVKRMPFGVFVDIGQAFPGLVLAPSLDPAGTPMRPEEFPALGARLEAVVVGVPEDRHQIALSCLLADVARFGH